MSSMQSAPATIPATSAETFGCAFAEPSPKSVSWAATRSPSPARWASAMAGASPAHDTRFASSKTADMSRWP